MTTHSMAEIESLMEFERCESPFAVYALRHIPTGMWISPSGVVTTQPALASASATPVGMVPDLYTTADGMDTFVAWIQDGGRGALPEGYFPIDRSVLVRSPAMAPYVRKIIPIGRKRTVMAVEAHDCEVCRWILNVEG